MTNYPLTTPLEQEIEAALLFHLKSLRDGFLDLLAALILAVIALVSVGHAILRIAFALAGLLLWSVALLILLLYGLRSLAVSRSSSSIHRRWPDEL